MALCGSVGPGLRQRPSPSPLPVRSNMSEMVNLSASASSLGGFNQTWGEGGTKRGKAWHTRSAPLLPASDQGRSTTWFSSASPGTTSRQPLWQPLGASFRSCEADGQGGMTRCSSNGSWANGCVPHWLKDSSMRKKQVLEHDLSWAYYRMARHAHHPLRQEVGENLPANAVIEQMRFGDKKFFFWRDLRPPFSVLEVRRLERTKGLHPDGALYDVVYECALDFTSERLWNMEKEGGTFDNKIHGVAKVRIPERYPHQRPITMLSWGKPCINWTPGDDEGDVRIIPPEQWMPIAEELKLRASDPRLEGCREATRRTRKPQKSVDVPPLQKLLLGAHTSLPRLVEVENQRVRALSIGGDEATLAAAAAVAASAKATKRPRQHRVYTPSCGFITYAG